MSMNIYSSSQTISKFVRQLSRYEPSSPSTTWYNKSEVDGGAIRSHFISFIFISGHPQSSIHCISEVCPFEGDINVIITDQNFFCISTYWHGNRWYKDQQAVWPDLAIIWTLGKFIKPLATMKLPKSPRFLGNFCKGVKIVHFSSEIIFGQLL